jgi:hypothetical protein
MSQELLFSPTEKQKVLWWALSELYLDTEHDPSWLEQLSSMILRAGWTKEEAHRAFLDEVAPAFFWNGLSVAGEWTSWSEAYVAEHTATYLSCNRLGRTLSVVLSKLTRPEARWQELAKFLG